MTVPSRAVQAKYLSASEYQLYAMLALARDKRSLPTWIVWLKNVLLLLYLPTNVVEAILRHLLSAELIARGRLIFLELRPQLEDILCHDWQACSKLDTYGSEIDMATVLADVIAKALTGVDIPIAVVSALVMKLGVKRFCSCQEH